LRTEVPGDGGYSVRQQMADGNFDVRQNSSHLSIRSEIFIAQATANDLVVTCKFRQAGLSEIAIDNSAYVTGATAISGSLTYIGLSEFFTSVSRYHGIALFDRIATDPEIAKCRTAIAKRQLRVL